ncbi:MAG: endonuclease [Lachnospiraceae bacterium]|nr:endonuclease [Lachnospiraceae bacterium]
MTKKSKKMVKRIMKGLKIAVCAVIVFVILFFIFMIITEYRPVDKQDVAYDSSLTVMEKRSFDIMTLNIGYGGLGEEMDFFMDGGTGVNPESEARVKENLNGIENILNLVDPDFYFIQEIDKDSSRSYHIDETAYLQKEYTSRAYAQNYVCKWVPYPIAHMIGSVDSGIMTLSKYKMDSAQRISLPNFQSWPKSMFMLKRCMLVNRIPLAGTDKQLVMVNFHLEAYDDDKTKTEQTKVVVDFIKEEYAKGNYVVAGGDFNQSFPGAEEVFPKLEGDMWRPGTIDSNMLPEGWKLCYNLDAPSCRSIDKPFTGLKDHQVFCLDGFILSPNLDCEFVATVNCNFKNTDHNPVYMRVSFADDTEVQ